MNSRVLVISQEPFLLRDTGGTRSIYSRWISLSDDNIIDIIYVDLKGFNEETENMVTDIEHDCFNKVLSFPRRSMTLTGKLSFGRVREVLRTLMSTNPRGCLISNKVLLKGWIEENIHLYDNIVCENIYSAQILDSLSEKVPHDIIAHNIEWLLSLRLMRKERSLAKKLFYMIDGLKLYFMERKLFRKAKRVFFLSYAEAQKIAGKGYHNAIHLGQHVIENEVKWHFSGSKKIIFNANLSYLPNIIGLRRFVEEIHPVLVVNIPDYCLIVTGKMSNDINYTIFPENIQFTGFLDESEFIEVFMMCDLMINPVIDGAGIKIKLLEALSVGIPIASYEDGLNVELGRYIHSAKDSNAFANLVILGLDNRLPKLTTFVAKEHNDQINHKIFGS